MVPYFMPMILPVKPQSPGSDENRTDTHLYLAEDFAFSHRARSAGFKIFADTTIRLGHLGSYGYSWEDSGGSNPQRFATYRFKIT